MNDRILKYINDALRSVRRIIDKSKLLTSNDFSENQDIIERNIITFTEALSRIEEKEPGFCNLHNIEYTKIKGLRNIIVHQYDFVHYCKKSYS